MRNLRSFLCLALLSSTGLLAGGELSGRRAPGFSLPDSNLQQHDLQDYQGRVVLLEFMQSQCPNCAKFSRVLEQVKAKFGDKIAGLSVTNPPDSVETVRQYAAANHVTVPVLFDCGQVAASYFKASSQSPSFHVPHVFLIDSQGAIRN